MFNFDQQVKSLHFIPVLANHIVTGHPDRFRYNPAYFGLLDLQNALGAVLNVFTWSGEFIRVFYTGTEDKHSLATIIDFVLRDSSIYILDIDKILVYNLKNSHEEPLSIPVNEIFGSMEVLHDRIILYASNAPFSFTVMDTKSNTLYKSWSNKDRPVNYSEFFDHFERSFDSQAIYAYRNCDDNVYIYANDTLQEAPDLSIDFGSMVPDSLVLKSIALQGVEGERRYFDMSNDPEIFFSYRDVIDLSDRMIFVYYSLPDIYHIVISKTSQNMSIYNGVTCKDDLSHFIAPYGNINIDGGIHKSGKDYLITIVDSEILKEYMPDLDRPFEFGIKNN